MKRKALVLGDLETAVLEAAWESGQLDVRAAHRLVGARRGIQQNTVQSTLERLHRKGLLAREKVSHAYVYSPRVSRDELALRSVEDVLVKLGQGEGQPLAAFVDLAERARPGALDELERLIAERKSKGGGR